MTNDIPGEPTLAKNAHFLDNVNKKDTFGNKLSRNYYKKTSKAQQSSTSINNPL